MSKKISARIGAGTLAVATVVAGLSFGPAAANASASTQAISLDRSSRILGNNPTLAAGQARTGEQFGVTLVNPNGGATSGAITFRYEAPRGTTFPKAEVRWGNRTGGTGSWARGTYGANLCALSERNTMLTCTIPTMGIAGTTGGGELGGISLWTDMKANNPLLAGGKIDDGAFKIIAGSYDTSFTRTISYTTAGTAPVAAWVDSQDLHARTATISGYGKPNASMIINDTMSVDADEKGLWSYTLTGLKLGANPVKVEQYEGENNLTGEAATVVNFDVAEISAAAAFVPDNTQNVIVTGTAQAGADVQIFSGSDMIKVVKAADITGHFSASLPAPNAGGTQEYTIKQSVDGELAVGSFDVVADFGTAVSITSPVNDQVHDGGAMTFQGRGVAGGSVVLREQGRQGVIGSATVLANGIWTMNVANIPGKKATYVATQTGRGNNVTTSAVTLNPDGDVTPPVVTPIVEGSNQLSGSNGTPGATIIVRDKDGNEVATGTVGADGSWNVTVPPSLGAGKHDLEVIERHDGQDSDATNVTVDFGAAVVATGATANAQGIVTYTGTGTAGAAVVVKGKSGRILATTTVGADGKWTAVSTTALPAGGYKVDVFQTTGIGVTSNTEIAFQVAPSTATPVTFTGPANGSTAYTATPTFSGKGQPGAKVEVGGTSRVIATTTVNAQGDWSVVSPIDLINGSYALQARQTPANGAAQTIATNAFQVDASPAAPVVVTGPADGSTVDGPRPVFTGTGTKGATITVKGSVKAIATTTVDSNGNWTVPAGIDLGKGGYVLTVNQKAPTGAEENTTVRFSIR